MGLTSGERNGTALILEMKHCTLNFLSIAFLSTCCFGTARFDTATDSLTVIAN